MALYYSKKKEEKNEEKKEDKKEEKMDVVEKDEKKEEDKKDDIENNEKKNKDDILPSYKDKEIVVINDINDFHRNINYYDDEFY